MRILIVASFNNCRFSPFVVEQGDALMNNGCQVEYFGVTGKGIKGYLNSLPTLKKTIDLYKPDIIHAHYGLCGLFANLQRRVPVVTTYHGSDINLKSVLPFSRLSMVLSRHNVLVSKRLSDIAHQRKKCTVLPCGLNLSDLQKTEKREARKRVGFDQDKKYVLFAGAFDNAVKNYSLAKEAMDLVPDAELIELKGYTRDMVTLLMCSADCFLMTSHTEGSPQVIKEAMTCGCPIVSVDVGDVKDVISGIEGCKVTSRNPNDIATAIKEALNFTGKTMGRKRIIALGLTNDIVAKKLLVIYNSILHK